MQCPYCNKSVAVDKARLDANRQFVSCLLCWRRRITSVEDYQRYVDIREMRRIDSARLEANNLRNGYEPERTSKRKVRSDKGMKRPIYRKQIRAIREEASKLQSIQKEIKRFERIEIKNDNKMSHGERKRIKRLQLIPEPRICPICLKPKPLTKQWVIKDDFIGCKGCYWRITIIPVKQKNKETISNEPLNNC